MDANTSARGLILLTCLIIHSKISIAVCLFHVTALCQMLLILLPANGCRLDNSNLSNENQYRLWYTHYGQIWFSVHTSAHLHISQLQDNTKRIMHIPVKWMKVSTRNSKQLSCETKQPNSLAIFTCIKYFMMYWDLQKIISYVSCSAIISVFLKLS